jgi:cell filamentation protein
MVDNSYCYPGTSVLRNKQDIRDPDELERFERMMVAQRMSEGVPSVEITPDGYRALHRHLFRDVNDWAGEDRTVDIGGHGTFFRSVEQVGRELDKRFAKINAEDNLRGLGPERFSDRAAEHICGLNAIHPFREGNGRTMRAFLQVLAEQAGYQIDLTRIEARSWNEASREADYTQDYRPMRAVIAAALVERAVERDENLADKDRAHEARQQTDEAYAKRDVESTRDRSKGRER